MRKLVYLVLAGVAVAGVQGCGNKPSQSEFSRTDSIRTADSLAAVRADSVQNAFNDSVARAGSMAKSDSLAKAGESAPL